MPINPYSAQQDIKHSVVRIPTTSTDAIYYYFLFQKSDYMPQVIGEGGSGGGREQPDEK